MYIAPPLIPAVAEFVFSLTSYHTTRHGVPRSPELSFADFIVEISARKLRMRASPDATDDATRRPTLISRLSIPYLSNEQTDGDNGNVAR